MVDTPSSATKRTAWAAIFSGTLVSVVLFVSVYSTRIFFLYWPQAFGFYICMLIRGIHTATKSDYALIAIPITPPSTRSLFSVYCAASPKNELQADLVSANLRPNSCVVGLPDKLVIVLRLPGPFDFERPSCPGPRFTSCSPGWSHQHAGSVR